MKLRSSLALFLVASAPGCGNLLGLDKLEYRDTDGTGGAAGTAGTAGTAGAAGTGAPACDPTPLAVSAINPPAIESEFEPEPAVGVRVDAAIFGTPRIRLTDASDGTECIPAVPEPLSPSAARMAYVCTAGVSFELRVVDLAQDMTPTVRATVPALPGGSIPMQEVVWDGDDAIFVHDGRMLSRFDLGSSTHDVINDFTASLSGAELESMTASDDRQHFAFIARIDDTASYFTWARQSGERIAFPFDDAERVSLAPSGSHLVVYRDPGLRLHDLASASLDGVVLGVGAPDFAPDEAGGVISGDAFVAGVMNGPLLFPTILSRKLTTPATTQALINFPFGSDGTVHLGASSRLPGWVAATRFNASSSVLSGEVFLLSDQQTIRRLARHRWGNSAVRPTPYLSKNACALVHPSNWGGPTTHVYLLDLR